MAVVIKMMSSENMPDANVSKGFKLYVLDPKYTYEFQRAGRDGFLVIKDQQGEEVIDHKVVGNCYIMDDGKTIATFSAAKYTGNEKTPQNRENLKETEAFSSTSQFGGYRIHDTRNV